MASLVEIFQYGFMQRALIAGIIVAVIGPLIGSFLVLKRYSLIADTLAHTSLTGVAMGLLLGIHPLITALLAAVAGSLGLEKIRSSTRVSGESALALFLSGSLAVAIILIGLARGFTVSLFSYLFGSLATVSSADLQLIAVAAGVVLSVMILFFKKLVFIAFDEEAAQVSGIPVGVVNSIFIILAAVTVSISIPIVGILLISALMIIPVLSAMQFKLPLVRTIILSQILALLALVFGLVISYHLDLATGGTVVIMTILFFGISVLLNPHKN